MIRLMSFVRIAASFVFLLLLAAPAAAAPTFPPLTGRVVDDAHVLSDNARGQLSQKLEDLESRTGRQLVVVTLASLQGYEIADYGYQLGRAWGIGQKKENNGVLFIVVPSEHKVRIEVGYGLEPILTDALSSVILERNVLPKFRDGDVEGGIVAGADAIVEQLTLDAPKAKARVAEAEQERARPHINPLIVLLVFFFVLSIMRRVFRGTGVGGLWLLPFLFSGGGGGWRGRDRFGGFGGGGFGGGSFGGGGFSGGGGSFGGGGASGSW
jgi:uncharacterized protein